MRPLLLNQVRPQRAGSGSPWALESLAGRLTELSALGVSGRLSVLSGLILEAQQAGEPVGWVCGMDGGFYPPDLATSGVALSCLTAVRVSNPKQIPRAAEHLARSGAFGLIVLDLPAKASIPAAMLSRLSGLAMKHGAAVVFLTEKRESESSLSSLVSLRMNTSKCRVRPGRFVCGLSALKDKRRGPGWTHEEVFRGPAGLR